MTHERLKKAVSLSAGVVPSVMGYGGREAEVQI
jgi:hypothetical protein